MTEDSNKQTELKLLEEKILVLAKKLAALDLRLLFCRDGIVRHDEVVALRKAVVPLKAQVLPELRRTLGRSCQYCALQQGAERVHVAGSRAVLVLWQPVGSARALDGDAASVTLLPVVFLQLPRLAAPAQGLLVLRSEGRSSQSGVEVRST